MADKLRHTASRCDTLHPVFYIYAFQKIVVTVRLLT